jgi:L-threonylcarbamoyladenylate synthase
MITEEELERAASLLRNGGLVALPTETVYGLGANALDVDAVGRIYAAKGRPATSPLIVHVASVDMARDLAREWTADASALVDRYWPGPLTIIVPKNPKVPDVVTSGLDTVALRMPAHQITLEVIRRAGVPIAAPSANRFTGLSPTTAEHVRQSLGEAVDMILDGGPCTIGIESTVLSLVGEPVLLRPGMISIVDLEQALGKAVKRSGKVETIAHPSPGMHDRHYAPRTPLRLVRDGMLPRGRGAYLYWNIASDAELSMPMPSDPARYARVLYEVLHLADEAGLDWIAVETPPATPEWAGVMDRLKRAAS